MNHKSANSREELKTYSRLAKKTYPVGGQEIKQDDLEVPLTTLNAVKYLLQGTLRLRVCRYCLNVSNKLSEFDEVLTLAVSGGLHEVTIQDIVASFHPYKVAEDPNFPNKICNECVNRAISCYLFTQQCDRAERALRNCLDDIYEKFEKLDPIEPVKRRGKRKLHPNHNVIHAEHNDVMGYAEPVINIVNVTNHFTVEQSNDKISELECKKCWQILPNVESLMNHENSHPKSMWFNCRLCGKSFVKCSHLRRHIKETHQYIEENSEEIKIDDFKCNECCSTNKTLGEHLQHNEKHKFKSLLKCLVEGKVDSLCTVCLDKSSHLTSLNDAVHLHGGYTGLTGDKSLENILTAVIPGPNQHKYDELLVPHQAKIIKLKKRKLNHQEKDLLSQKMNKKFVYAAPVLVQKIDFEFTNSITYTFSKPFFFIPVKDLNEPKVLECSLAENECDDINIDHSSKEMCAEQKYNSVNPELKEEISCKICWMFKTPNCMNCLKNKLPVSIAKKPDEVVTKDVCKFCWIFEKTGKCDYCNKYINCKDKICTDDSTDIIVQNVHETLKEKEIKKVSIKVKEIKIWQCNVCLTSNSNNRLRCICCDKENEKSNFGNWNSFNSDPISSSNNNVHSETNITNETTHQVDIKTANEKMKLLDNKTEKDITTLTGVKDKNHNLPKTNTKEGKETLSYSTKNYSFLPDVKDDINVNSQVIINENIDRNSTNRENRKCLPDIKDVSEDSKMDVETIEFKETDLKHSMDNNASIDIIEKHAMDSNIEDMDVVFDNILRPDSTTDFSSTQKLTNEKPTMETNPNIFPSFTFNLGANDSKDCKNRRTRKAIKRNATTSYK